MPYVILGIWLRDGSHIDILREMVGDHRRTSNILLYDVDATHPVTTTTFRRERPNDQTVKQG